MLARLLALLPALAAAQCDMPDGERLDAWDGAFALNEEACTSRGACWRVHETPGVPWCFWRAGERPESDEAACAAVQARGDCAPPGRGMNEMMCLTAGCCWGPGAEPACYYPYDAEGGGASPSYDPPSRAASSEGGDAARRHQQLETAFSAPAGEGGGGGGGVREHTEGFGSGEHLLRQRVAAWRTPALAAARAAAALAAEVYTPPLSSPPLPPGAPLSAVNPAWQGTASLPGSSPVAPPSRTLTAGPARFTVLSDGLFRAEWSPHAPPRFHDSASLLAVNRAFPGPPPAFTHARTATGLTITTPLATLVYSGSGPFTPASLSVTIAATGAVWRPGAAPAGSLHGTIRTLDRIGKPLSLACAQAPHVNDTHCVEGPLSRDGWAVLDDSLGARFGALAQEVPWVAGPAEEAPWVSGGGAPGVGTCAAAGWDRYQCVFGNKVDRALCVSLGCCYDEAAAAAAAGHAQMWNYVPWCYHPSAVGEGSGGGGGGSSDPGLAGGWGGSGGYKDLYVFARGRDYVGAMADYRLLSGPIAQLPRYALGPMFSRWMGYHDSEEREVVATYARNNVPLDVMIVDMDWHDSYPRGAPLPPSGRKVPTEPWTGFTVWPALWPTPGATLAAFKARGVRTVFNLHPHYGVQYFDATYGALAAALGEDAASGMPLQGDYTNATWADAFLRTTIAPLEALGVDAWWVDWQQNEWSEVMGAPSQLWSSYVFFSNPHRYGARAAAGALAAAGSAPSDRPMVLNRWGGYGHHRYPFGFSGDADTNWGILRFQVYLTATAANVAWSWSHDIGGFTGTPSPELMTRWVQMGVFSPILRPHTAGKSGSHRDIWGFPFPAFEVMRDYFRLRARLVPYLASEYARAGATGVLPVHPLYYHWPHAPGVYGEPALHGHTFGRDILAAPITAPAPTWASAAELAEQPVWLPPGRWVEWGSWALVEGGEAAYARGGGRGCPKGMGREAAEAEGGVMRERGWAAGEMPLYSPPGAIIPLRSLARGASALGSAGAPLEDLTLLVLPAAAGLGMAPGGAGRRGALTSRRALHEDDGVSVEYVTLGASSSTEVSCEWRRGGAEVAAVGAGGGARGAARKAGSGVREEEEEAEEEEGGGGFYMEEEEEGELPAVEGALPQPRVLTGAAAAAAARAAPGATPTPPPKKKGLLSALFGGGGGSEEAAPPAPRRRAAPDLAGTDTLTCAIAPAVGNYSGAPAARAWTWRFVATLPPATVTIDGVAAPRDASAGVSGWGDDAAWASAAALGARLGSGSGSSGEASVGADGSAAPGGAAPPRGAWAYAGESLSTWVRLFERVPRGVGTTVQLTWPAGVRAHTEAALFDGAPRMVARAQAAKQQMNRAPFEAFVVDIPDLFDVLSAPALLEAAPSPAAALGTLNALRGHVEGALNAVRTTMRTSQPPLDKDVVVRMERLLQDSLT